MLRVLVTLLLSLGSALVVSHAEAQPADIGSELAPRVEQLARQAAQAVVGSRPDVRIEVEAGKLDPRLRLAPCAKVDVYLPPGQRAWGSSRVGIRCLEGTTRWNVYLPLTVRVWAPAVQVSAALPSGTVLTAAQLRLGIADWSASETPPIADAAALEGRQLVRGLAAGEAVHDADLKRRQWFASGEPVTIVATGSGFSVAGEGIALTPGIEGQPARVRVEGGRTLTGLPRPNRRIEVPL